MKCEICGEEAKHRFSPDLDIEGLGACEEHKENMEHACFILFQSGEKAYYDFIKRLQGKPEKKIRSKK